MKELDELLDLTNNAIRAGELVKITLSKSRIENAVLQNVYIRPVLIKNKPQLSFLYRNKTNDQTKNKSQEEGLIEFKELISNHFYFITVFTTVADYSLQISKKGTATFQKQLPSFKTPQSLSHDREKIKRAVESDYYLTLLGINDKEGKLIPSMADKYRQINKYLEIIDGLLKSVTLPEQVNIVDMGSGKGYLTFALYDYLTNKLNINTTITGIELRPELVDYCNTTASLAGFSNLHFVCKPIDEYFDKSIDVLIALHACDTATDDAIYKGIISNASVIICAPCCHKQIRQQLKGIEQNSPLLKYGIFKERQFEMVTDTIRALVMEEHHYQTKIFEFISNEHTRKNIMLVGTKSSTKNNKEEVASKIEEVKNEFQIKFHYLEKLFEQKN